MDGSLDLNPVVALMITETPGLCWPSLPAMPRESSLMSSGHNGGDVVVPRSQCGKV